MTIPWGTILTGAVSGAVIAALVTGLWNLLNARIMLYAAYKLEQKKKLRQLIGEYHSRMLEAALDWDRRMTQLYESKGQHMTPVNGTGADARYEADQYFYQSVVFRFLSLLSIARNFEAQAFYIDSRIAHGKELDFLRFAKSFLWVMTFSDLTKNDGMPGVDHFRNDEFRPLLDACYRREEGVLPQDEPKPGEVVFDMRRYRTLVNKSKPPPHEPSPDNGQGRDKRALDPDTALEVQRVLEFFAGVRPREYARRDNDESGIEYKRRRWERIVCLHLLVICFIGTFGYAWQRDDKEIEEKRKKAIDELAEEASQAGAQKEGEPFDAEVGWQPVLNVFLENLDAIGMHAKEHKPHLHRLRGIKQVSYLKRDLESAIGTNEAPPRTNAALLAGSR